MTRVAAVDLGASSGRVIAGHVHRDAVTMHEVHRFPNQPVRTPTGLRWDLLRLWHEILTGLAETARGAQEVASIGIDTWAIDYGLIDDAGELLGSPVHYRDERTNGIAERFDAVIGRQALYERNGLQQLPFTTLYQLIAARGSVALDGAHRLLLLPDLLSSWLGAPQVAELTNASTTGLLDVTTRTWSPDLVEAAGVRLDLLAPLVAAGEVLGSVSPEVRADTGLASTTVVTAVGSHDTASAVVGTPLDPEHGAYIACGTWALVGVELERPVLSPASRLAGFTNEGGVDGTIRYLHNVMGLWVLQESLRVWQGRGEESELSTLLAQAEAVPAGGPVIDIDDPSLLPPGPMPDRIAQLCRAAGSQPPATQAETVRCILDSLAAAFARTVRSAGKLSGRDIRVVHLVGGGARNALLCQLTADACGLPVLAGPVESTALGNILVQARALGAVSGDLASLRDLVRRSSQLRRYSPSPTNAPGNRGADRRAAGAQRGTDSDA